MNPKPIKISLSILFAITLLFTYSCSDSPTETPESVIRITDSDLTVELTKNQICEYMASGGEDGATIKTQAKHFEISEINRGTETGYSAIYRYKPKPNYVGYDFVELEIMSDAVPIDEPYVGKIVKIEFFVK